MVGNESKLNTIAVTLRRLRADGYQISESALRGWVRNGTLPATWCGRKALLFYPAVLQFLETGTTR